MIQNMSTPLTPIHENKRYLSTWKAGGNLVLQMKNYDLVTKRATPSESLRTNSREVQSFRTWFMCGSGGHGPAGWCFDQRKVSWRRSSRCSSPSRSRSAPRWCRRACGRWCCCRPGKHQNNENDVDSGHFWNKLMLVGVAWGGHSPCRYQQGSSQRASTCGWRCRSPSSPPPCPRSSGWGSWCRRSSPETWTRSFGRITGAPLCFVLISFWPNFSQNWRIYDASLAMTPLEPLNPPVAVTPPGDAFQLLFVRAGQGEKTK